MSECVVRVNQAHPFELDVEITLPFKDLPDELLLQERNAMIASKVPSDVLAGHTGYSLPESVKKSVGLGHQRSIGEPSSKGGWQSAGIFLRGHGAGRCGSNGAGRCGRNGAGHCGRNGAGRCGPWRTSRDLPIKTGE